MNNMKRENEKFKLIKKLLSRQLTQKRRQDFANNEWVLLELKKQWDHKEYTPIEQKVKEDIWNQIEKRCVKSSSIIFQKRKWYAVAASITILFFISATLWFTNNNTKTEQYIEIYAKESRIYTLPDSSKVWMQPGSSIRFVSDFNKKRNVWLTGNSLFEVRKHNGQPFQVYIQKAFIEVKGTSFLIKQNMERHKNEITLFNGKIDFHIIARKESITLSPMQKIIYDSSTAQTEIKDVSNINWKDGRYFFKDTPLSKLATIINQLYDTNIMLEVKIEKEAVFTGSIRYDESLEEVVDKICFTLNLKKEKRNNQIIIDD